MEQILLNVEGEEGVKIMTTLFHRRGKVINFGGKFVKFDELGVACLTKDAAETLLVDYADDLEYFDADSIKGVDELEGEELLNSLRSLTIVQLKTIAENRNYPQKQWIQYTTPMRFAKYLSIKIEEDRERQIALEAESFKEKKRQEVLAKPKKQQKPE